MGIFHLLENTKSERCHSSIIYLANRKRNHHFHYISPVRLHFLCVGNLPLLANFSTSLMIHNLTSLHLPPCNGYPGTQLMLTLSACYDSEYTCGDASCVQQSQRCDLRVDCPDKSDETGCDKLDLPQGYMSALTPAAPTPGPLPVNLSLVIHGFSQVCTRIIYLCHW